MTHSAEWIGRSPAIARVNNAEAERWEDTDWEQIVLLYDMLLHLASSPVTRLHRAIAVRYAAGTRAAGGALRGSVQYREGARTGHIGERRENGEVPTGNASSGAMTSLHNVLDEVRPVARSCSRHASSPGARHSKWSGKARISAPTAALPVRLAGRPGVSKAVSRRRSSTARTDARESSPTIAQVAFMSTADWGCGAVRPLR